MIIGLIGLPRSGKTTIFHLLTGTEANPDAAFKREILRGLTHVPDPRVDRLSEISRSKKTTYATVEFVDTPGLDEANARGDWFAQAVGSGLKTADALLLVAGAFDTSTMATPKSVLGDIRTIQDELVFTDLTVIESRLDKLRKQRKVKSATPQEALEAELLERSAETLNGGKPLRTLSATDAEKKVIRGFQLLSEKAALAVVNCADSDFTEWEGRMAGLGEELGSDGIRVMTLSALLEGEIARFDEAERAEFMADLGANEPARDRVLKASYEILGLQSFLTTGEKESRAWPLRRGGTAQEAAGVIHTDLAKGFIRAEVVNYDDFVREGGYPGCKAKGHVRLEGKEYSVKDGDVLLIRHSG